MKDVVLLAVSFYPLKQDAQRIVFSKVSRRLRNQRFLLVGAMFKTSFPILLAIFMSNVALADVVRHGSLPDSSWGVWTTTDPNHVVVDLSAKTYADNEENCVVNWVSETPGAGGPIYSAHLQCSRRSDRGEKRFTLNLVIWPKSSDEIALGPGFTSLKIFHRCRATRPPPTGVARSRDAPLNSAETGSQGECRIDGNM
jgi:hypothetical protein